MFDDVLSLSPAELAEQFPDVEDRKAIRLAALMGRSLARAGVRSHADQAPATLARRTSAAVVAPEPERVPVARNLTTELRDSEAHRASQSQPTLTLRRPPAPTGTCVERHAHTARPTDTVPVGRNLTDELRKGGRQ